MSEHLTTINVIGGYLDELCEGFGDNVQRLTCREMDALASVYALCGRRGVAAELIHIHADDANEDGGDFHYEWTLGQCAAYVDSLVGEVSGPCPFGEACPWSDANGVGVCPWEEHGGAGAVEPAGPAGDSNLWD